MSSKKTTEEDKKIIMGIYESKKSQQIAPVSLPVSIPQYQPIQKDTDDDKDKDKDETMDEETILDVEETPIVAEVLDNENTKSESSSNNIKQITLS